MKRSILAGFVFFTTSLGVFAQTKLPPIADDGLAKTGKVVSNSIVLPVTHANGPLDSGKPCSNVVAAPNCAAPCEPGCESGKCPTKHAKSGHSWAWFTYQSSEVPCECKKRPTDYQPPLIAFFACKGKYPYSQNTTPTGCSTGGCASGTPSAAATITTPAISTTPGLMPNPGGGTPPRMDPTLPTTSLRISNKVQQAAAKSSGKPEIKPLSLYAPLGSKGLTEELKISPMSKSGVAPAIGGTTPYTPVPGYRRLGGSTKE